MSLTVAAIEKMKPGKSRREVPDDRPRGLYLVIHPSGKKSWAVRARLHGKPVKVTIGPYPAWDLRAARDEAGRILQAIDRGEDPREIKRAARAEAEQRDCDRFEVILEAWLERDQKHNRTYEEVRRAMERHVRPKWRGRPISGIRRRDVAEVLDGIVAQGTATRANRVHAYLHRLFKWSVGRGIIDTNPAADLPKATKETKRDRVLTDDELARVWRAAETMGYPFGPALQLLILTGARRDEITSLRWREVGEDAIELTGERTKTGEARVIPLSGKAHEIVNALPRITGARMKRPEWCLTTTGRSAISGWGKAKERLDRIAAGIDAAGETLDEAAPLPDWRLHDLRRTCATGLQRLGVRLEVTESVLGHLSGSRAGVVGIYQRYDWEAEKRAALEAWARHIAGLIEPKPGTKIHSIAEARA